MNIENLTESEAFDLFHRLKSKFDWAGTVTSMGDVIVYPEGEEPWWSDDNPPMTDAMREAVRETYEWRRAIDERSAEVGNSLAPKIEVLPNGDFIIHTESHHDVLHSASGE